MRIDPRANFILVLILAFSTLFLLPVIDAQAQQLAPEVAQHGYADTIFVNGKVVSMDDTSQSANPGNIYQGMAIKGDRIMKLGTSAQIRALAGPDTTTYDLQGRTVIPGIVETHSHMYGGAVQLLDRLGFKYPPDGVSFFSATAHPTDL